MFIAFTFMRSELPRRPLATWLAVILAFCLAFSLPAIAAGPCGQNETVILLVRHADQHRR